MRSVPIIGSWRKSELVNNIGILAERLFLLKKELGGMAEL